MESSASSISSMTMFEDESVDVRLTDGSQLQLSPCACEFMFTSGGPLATTQRVRQRTRFTTSSYREMTSAALTFRNKYATRPYLPVELLPAADRQPLASSIDTEVQWPRWSSNCCEVGAAGETIVKAEDGRAVLKLSPSGEDFSVQFSCRLSQPNHGRRHHCKEPTNIEDLYQSTVVVQHHSCMCVPPAWCHPLSLARSHRSAPRSEPTGDEEFRDSDEVRAPGSSFEGNSALPLALPLTCLSPHRHRWKGKDFTEQDSPTELLKVMWCKGVTYRILSGAVPVIEVSLDDGSVMRSNGVLSNYFTHYKPEFHSDGMFLKVTELTHHLKSLPPDVPGRSSVSSIVRRASRILSCYNQAKHSLKLSVLPSCLQEDCTLTTAACQTNPAQKEQHQHEHTRESLSSLVSAELEKIKRFNFLVDNGSTPLRSTRKTETSSATVVEETLSENSIREALQRTSRVLQDIDLVLSL